MSVAKRDTMRGPTMASLSASVKVWILLRATMAKQAEKRGISTGESWRC